LVPMSVRGWKFFSILSWFFSILLQWFGANFSERMEIIFHPLTIFFHPLTKIWRQFQWEDGIFFDVSCM
jgi:hypothetical protein